MSGIGISHGAVSVMNAIPCGIGSTIGIDLTTEAKFDVSDETKIILFDRPNLKDDLVKCCVTRTLERIGQEPIDYELTVRTQIPPSMGLKSSSSVCNAVISSVLQHFGERMEQIDIIKLGVECAKECKVTITGAFDDACGCGLGGLVITNNSDNRLIERIEIPRYDVVICVPDRMIPKNKVPVEKYKALASKYEEMVPSISTDYLKVLTMNGAYVQEIIDDDSDIAMTAMSLGALAAGITGTGPATAIIAEKGKGKDLAKELGLNTIITETR